jgi:hypothetical protein
MRSERIYEGAGERKFRNLYLAPMVLSMYLLVTLCLARGDKLKHRQAVIGLTLKQQVRETKKVSVMLVINFS